jgi:hypothetical protein
MAKKQFYIIFCPEENTWLTNSKQRNRTNAQLSDTLPPRLFTTHLATQNVLNWWREGDYDIILTPIPERKQLNLEIRKISLEIL